MTNLVNQYETLIRRCDQEIRAGRSQSVSHILGKINVARIPREWRMPLARICRRAGLLSLGLRLLSRPMFNKQGGPPPTVAETAEYSILLLRSGAVHESLKRLYALDPVGVPDAHLFRAYAHFALWEYRESIPELRKYLEAAVSPANVLVGQTNLAFALAECREHSQALKLVEENIQLAQSEKHWSLEGFNRAIGAQVHLQEQDYIRAQDEIRLARIRPADSSTHDQFFVTKIELLANALQGRNPEIFNELRCQALRKRDWFALRDADFFELQINFNLEQFLHLYCGSPLPRFRELMHQQFAFVPDRDIYVLGKKATPRLDLESGKLEGKNVLKKGGKCHQLVEVLLRDFYERPRTAGLHAALFPTELFHISSSPDRIRQLIRRTRAEFRRLKIPLSLKEEHGFYSLELESHISFRIPIHRRPMDLTNLRLRSIKDVFSRDTVFSAQQVCAKLGISTSAAHRLLREG